MRHRLGVFLLLPLCFGFDWPGRLARLEYQVEHGDVSARLEAVRRLGAYAPADVHEALIAALDDSAAPVRLAAVTALGEVRAPEAVPILLDWATDKDVVLRRAVLRALGAIGDLRAHAVLTRALGDSLPDVRIVACEALHRLGSQEAVAPLIAAMQDGDPSVRRAAIEALHGLADGTAVVALSARARDDSPEVRAAAFTLLGKLHDPRALPFVLQGLHDGDSDARLAAAMAAGTLGDAGALAELAKLLEGEAALGRASLAAIGRIADARADAMLIGALQKPELALTARAAIVERARRGSDVAPTVASLAAALSLSKAPELSSLIADMLRELASFGSIAGASDALIAALHAHSGDDARLALALVETRSENAVVPLLEALETIDERALPELLEGLSRAAALDGRATDPLLARLEKTHGEARVALVRAIGETAAARALPALLALAETSDSLALRLAAIEALGRIADPAAAPKLGELLGDREGDVRDAAAHALANSASEPELVALLDALESTKPLDRHALLVAIGGALPRLRREHLLHKTTYERAVRLLSALIAGDDDAIADRALDALRYFAPSEASSAIAQLWRKPSTRRRAAATRALGAFAGPTQREETRKLLRFMLQQASQPLALAIAGALGDVGDQRDVAALLHLTRRKHWPVPAAAAFAIARIAQRGEARKIAATAELCELGKSRNPYVRANVAAALAAFGGPACDAQVDPLHWLGEEHASVVRVAAAYWAKAAVAAGHAGTEPLRAALRECAADLDPSVRAACASTSVVPQVGGATRIADLYAYTADGSTKLPHHLIALRLPGGAVFIGNTDSNAHVLLDAVPPGELRLEDPALEPLEPPP